MNNDKMITWLNKNRLHNIDMLENLRTGKAFAVNASDGGVLLKMDDIYFLAANTSADADLLTENVKEINDVACHNRESALVLEEKYGLVRQMECYNAVWDFSNPPPMPDVDVEICPLGIEWFSFITQNYHNAPPAYIEGRVKAGVMVGAFLKNKLVGFAGEHEEGSMGMLEILPKFRRRGVGSALSCYLINRILEQGRVPFAQIETDNEASLKMQRKAGFLISDGIVTWSGKN